jgi:hypothetical protein
MPTTATITVPDLLELAARRLTTYGWHNGVDWVDCKPGVTIFARPAWGQAHLYLAVGCDPYLRGDSRHTPPPVVRQTEDHLAEYLIHRGEQPRWDGDGFVDPEAQIDRYESDDDMTGAEVAQMFRDAAEHWRVKAATKNTTRTEVAA